MKYPTSLLLFAAAAAGLFAQSSVTDDFSSAANWTPVTVNGPGGFTIGSGRANYTASGNTDAYLLWNAGTFSATSNWAAQVDVRAKQASVAAPFDYFYGSLTAFRTGDTLFSVNSSDVPQYFSVSADIIRPGGSTNAFQTSYTVAGDDFYENPSNGLGISANTTLGALRVTFDSATHTLATWFDANGATGGYAWTQISTLDIVGDVNWGMTSSSTFSLALSANSGSDVLTSGNVYFDNFSVTAVPEPSTYAVFAGLGALGLALGRQRVRHLRIASRHS